MNDTYYLKVVSKIYISVSISKEQYTKTTFSKLFAGYFDNSSAALLSFIVKEQNLTKKDIEELQSLINKNAILFNLGHRSVYK
ncbi:MAG: hypothetical protein EOO85_05855 [Pedobacter sp.]|nr:MAG: hypothetical protein EOO85_05855 [Pedobacter sp.]